MENSKKDSDSTGISCHKYGCNCTDYDPVGTLQKCGRCGHSKNQHY